MSRLNVGWKLWQPFSEVNYVWMNRVSSLVTKLVMDGLAANLFGVTGTSTEHGAAQTGWIGDSCRASLSSGLIVSVSAGLGFADTVALSGATADEWTPSYVPMALLTAATVTHDAHDGSIRYDWVYATPGTTNTDATSLRYREVSGGAASDTVAQTTRWRATAAIQKGTAGAGIPTLTSGRVPIALVKIPATSGTITVYDARTVLRFGRAVAPIPDGGIDVPYAQAVVQDVTISTPSGMVIPFTAVWLDVSGSRRLIANQQVTVATAHVSLDRIDTIYALKESEGHWTLNIASGTAAADPVAASVPTGGVKVAEVDVPAGDTAIGVLQIRASAGAVYPYTTDMVDDVAEQVIRARVTVLAQPVNPDPDELKREVEIDLYDRHGRRVRKTIPLILTVFNVGDGDELDNYPASHTGTGSTQTINPDDVTEGTIVGQGLAPYTVLMTTSANGRIRGLKLNYGAADSYAWFVVEPVAYADAVDEDADATAGDDDWIPGAKTMLRVHFRA